MTAAVVSSDFVGASDGCLFYVIGIYCCGMCECLFLNLWVMVNMCMVCEEIV